MDVVKNINGIWNRLSDRFLKCNLCKTVRMWFWSSVKGGSRKWM